MKELRKFILAHDPATLLGINSIDESWRRTTVLINVRPSDMSSVSRGAAMLIADIAEPSKGEATILANLQDNQDREESWCVLAVRKVEEADRDRICSILLFAETWMADLTAGSGRHIAKMSWYPEYTASTVTRLVNHLHVKRYLDKEFFSIENVEGRKTVHIHGYVYKAGGRSEDGRDYRKVELTFCMAPVKEFIEGYGRQGTEYVDLLEAEVKQYIGDCTEEEALNIARNYYGRDAEPVALAWDQITEETPEGDYILP